MAKVIKLYETEISDDDLYRLILKYSDYYYKVLVYKDGYHVERDEVFGELALKACEARVKFKGKSNIKTYLVSCFRNHINDYRKWLDVRQRQYPPLFSIKRT